MSTTGSAELFKFELVNGGSTLETEVKDYTVISTGDAAGNITHQFFEVESEKMMIINEIGNGIHERLFMIPMRNIRWIKCFSN